MCPIFRKIDSPPFSTYGQPLMMGLQTSPKTPVQPDPAVNWTASPVSINIKENQQPAEADTAWSFHTQQGEGGKEMKWGNFDINPFFLVSLLLLLSPFLNRKFLSKGNSSNFCAQITYPSPPLNAPATPWAAAKSDPPNLRWLSEANAQVGNP